MRIVSGVAVLALVLGAACANRSATAQTPGPAGATATAGGAQAGSGAGAQAAARVTEEDLDAAMKTVARANGALGMKLAPATTDLPGAAKDAQDLATAFATAERFFAQASKADAVAWAQQGRTGSTEVAAAATAGDAAKATAARSNITSTCKQCHAIYREGDATAGYKVKAGTI